jgi:hypothetical protein
MRPAFDGEQLTLDMIDDSCNRVGTDESALTIIFESAPFTRQQTGAQTAGTDTTVP